MSSDWHNHEKNIEDTGRQHVLSSNTHDGGHKTSTPDIAMSVCGRKNRNLSETVFTIDDCLSGQARSRMQHNGRGI